MEVRVSAQIVYEESQDMDQYATRIHLYALFRALFSRELALQLFRTKTCRALLLTASPRGPSAARGDTCGRVAALKLRGK